ncbi:MAG: Asp-tRNA(Asn)/Glu-tRNA(Gln) amidotransferase subunit GatC [Verrucomicrobiota bacterium]
MNRAELDLDALARLARLALSPEEKATFARQLAELLGHIERLSQLDVSGVEPSAHAHPQHNVWQEDTPRPGLPPVAALRNAPAQRDQMIAVPKVVE